MRVERMIKYKMKISENLSENLEMLRQGIHQEYSSNNITFIIYNYLIDKLNVIEKEIRESDNNNS